MTEYTAFLIIKNINYTINYEFVHKLNNYNNWFIYWLVRPLRCTLIYQLLSFPFRSLSKTYNIPGLNSVEKSTKPATPSLTMWGMSTRTSTSKFRVLCATWSSPRSVIWWDTSRMCTKVWRGPSAKSVDRLLSAIQ